MLSKKLLPQFLDGTMTDHRAYVCGRYRDYYIVTYQVNNASTQVINLSATSERDPGASELNGFLNALLPEYKQLKTAAADGHSLTLTFVVGSPKKFVEIANDVVNRVVLFLKQYSYTSGCASCGEQYGAELYLVNGRYLWLCPACAAKLTSELEDSKAETKAKSSNIGAGIVGAFLGALIGAALYVLIFQLGYIAGICGFVMAVLAMKFYEKLGGCLDLKGVIASVAVVLIMVFFANKLAWSWSAYMGLKDYGWDFFDCYGDLNYIIEASELKRQYVSNLTVGYLLTVVGCARSFINAAKGSTGSYSFKKVES